MEYEFDETTNDAGKRIALEGDVEGLLYPAGWRGVVFNVRAGGGGDFSASIDLSAVERRVAEILGLNPDLTTAICMDRIDTLFSNHMGASWQGIGGNLSAHRRRFELARRCRQYQRRLTCYEVSPYEIYARLYNRAHPARHISAKWLNRVQIQRALHLFYHHQMPADYRRQR